MPEQLAHELPNLRIRSKRLEELSKLLHEEVSRHFAATDEFRQRMRLWIDFYEGRVGPVAIDDDRPIIMMPFATINVDAIKAQIKQAIRAATQQFIARPIEIVDKTVLSEAELDVDWARTATSFERAANWLAKNSPSFNWDRFLDDWTDELAKIGTVIIKTFYDLDTQRTKKFDPITGRVQPVLKVRRDGPVAEVVPLDRCVWQIGYSDLRDMWFFGHWFELSSTQLRSRIESADYRKKAVDKILKSPNVKPTESEEHKDKLEGVESNVGRASRGGIFRLYEFWLTYDIDEDGVDEDLFVIYHKKTGEIVKVAYQPYRTQPFEKSEFEPRGNRFLARGAIEPLEHMIRGGSTIVNQVIHAQTIANANMVTAPIGSEAEVVMQSSGVKPGLILPVSGKEEADAIQEKNVGNPGALVSLELLEAFRAFVERLSHVSDPQLGRIEGGKRTPAATVLSLLQEGTRLIDEVISRQNPVAGRVALKLIELHQQADPGFWGRILDQEDGDLITQAFQIAENVSQFVKVELNPASATQSKQVEQQSLMTFSQMVIGYAKQVMELAVPFTNPNVPDEWRAIAVEVIRAIQKTMMSLAEVFQQDEPIKLIPQVLAVFENVAQAISVQRQQVQSQEQQAGLPPGAGQTGGVDFTQGGGSQGGGEQEGF